jgi:hypothetical protein
MTKVYKVKKGEVRKEKTEERAALVSALTAPDAFYHGADIETKADALKALRTVSFAESFAGALKASAKKYVSFAGAVDDETGFKEYDKRPQPPREVKWSVTLSGVEKRMKEARFTDKQIAKLIDLLKLDGIGEMKPAAPRFGWYKKVD